MRIAESLVSVAESLCLSVSLCDTMLTMYQLFAGTLLLVASAANAVVADHVYRNAVIFTADSAKPQADALAIREGKIIYVGNQPGLNAYVDAKTQVVDLKGRFLMPGIIDGHMHPLEAGTDLLKCDLNYESLTVPELQRKVQLCLDKPNLKGPEAWLEVVNWFQESMIPAGVKTSHEVLDVLKTQRPVILKSSFGHTVLANTRALVIAKISAATPDPIAGKIWRDVKGAPTGLLEDAAFDVFATLIPKPTAQQNIDAAVIALKAMNKVDRNPLTVPAEDIAKTQVLQTLVGGKIVYDNALAPP